MATHTQQTQTVTYIPFGSFVRPTTTEVNDKRLHTIQSPEFIRREVTSFDVKPLYPRPSFPKPAQILPLGPNENTVLCEQHNIQKCHPGQYSSVTHMNQGLTTPGNVRSCHPEDENFVYIHRQNSFIDVSKMTHHDHSSSKNSSDNDETARSRTRSHDEVDAAMTLATCLKIENKH